MHKILNPLSKHTTDFRAFRQPFLSWKKQRKRAAGNEYLPLVLSYSCYFALSDFDWFMQMFSGKLRVINSNNITNVRMPSDDNTSYENSVVTIDEIKNIIVCIRIP